MTELQFRERLVWARSKRGISQQQLAEASEIAPAQISRYEAGRAMPRPQIIAKLATALSIDFEWLLSGRGAPSGDLPSYLGKPDQTGWAQIWIPSELFGQLKRSADLNKRPLEVEAAIRLKRSLSTEAVPGSVGMQELHSRVEELQRLIQSTMKSDRALAGEEDELSAEGGLIGGAQQTEMDGYAEAPVSESPESAPSRKKRKITMVKKSHHEIKHPDQRDPGHAPRTIPVEVRKKRTYIRRADRDDSKP